MRLDEIYDHPLSSFKTYMTTSRPEFEPDEWWDEICELIADKGWDNVLHQTVGDLRKADPHTFYDFPIDIQRKLSSNILRFAKMNAPERLPTQSVTRFERVIKPSSWLIHFTEHAEQIADKGFIYGIDRMDRLGYTKFCAQHDKRNGGWNFAFTADNPLVGKLARRGKYGRHAVMFRTGGVELAHRGDNEKQVVFWGKNVDPSDIIVLLDGWDGYKVMSRNAAWTLKTGRNWVYAGDFERCVEFVIQNFQQYKQIITGSIR